MYRNNPIRDLLDHNGYTYLLVITIITPTSIGSDSESLVALYKCSITIPYIYTYACMHTLHSGLLILQYQGGPKMARVAIRSRAIKGHARSTSGGFEQCIFFFV